MGYYVRLLSLSDAVPPLKNLMAVIATRPTTELRVENGSPQDWDQLLLAHVGNEPIALIERNMVRPGELGAEEIAEFQESVADCEPASAAAWLGKYLSKVKCIYAFQILSGAYTDDGWSAMDAVRN